MYHYINPFIQVHPSSVWLVAPHGTKAVLKSIAMDSGILFVATYGT